MVAGILNRLKARLEREFEGQRQTCARQLAELRDRIAVRKEKIATNKDKIEQLLNDVERRNRERRADMVLLEKASLTVLPKTPFCSKLRLLRSASCLLTTSSSLRARSKLILQKTR